MRSQEEIEADAVDQQPFSNHTEYEIWADQDGCDSCANDNPETEKWCPILAVALLGKWPKEWQREMLTWDAAGQSGAYEVVGECSEFVPDDDDDDDGDEDPVPPAPTGPAVEVQGQLDILGAWADQAVDQLQRQHPVSV